MRFRQNQIKQDAGSGLGIKTLTYPNYRYIGYTDGVSQNVAQQMDGNSGPEIRAVVGIPSKSIFDKRTGRFHATAWSLR